MTDRDEFLTWVNSRLKDAEIAIHDGNATHCASYEFELLAADVVGDMAYTAGLEHTTATINGEPRSYTLRATQIYRRDGGEWRVAHRHGDTVSE